MNEKQSWKKEFLQLIMEQIDNEKKGWKKYEYQIFFTVILAVALISYSFIAGLFVGVNGVGYIDSQSRTFKKEYCVHRSIASKYNIFYVAGCELTKPRY